MNYLLDTHVFLWSVFEPDKLSGSVREALKKTETAVSISVVTFWEIALKYALGKLVLKNCTPEDLVITADRLSFNTLGLSRADASSFHQLPKKKHKDPFDRMIVWQAIQNNCILISKDGDLGSYKEIGLKIFW